MATRQGMSVLVLLLILSFLEVCWTSGPRGEEGKPETDGLLVVTVATEENDGFRRFMRSAKTYGLTVKVIGMGVKWDGGEVERFPGGGHKVNLLADALKEYKDRDDLVIMFVDSYDVVFSAGPEAILNSFKSFDSKVVFAAEGFCWPDAGLADKYPVVKMNEKRYLNSGGYIGYAPQIYEIVTHKTIGNKDDDQLYYTRIFLDKGIREKKQIKLDNRGEIFQNLNGALDEVRLKFKGSSSYLYNVRTGNKPMVIHGNGPIKVEFNGLANYLADQWTPTTGCRFCEEDTISLAGVKHEDFPRVMIGIFLEHPTAFIEEFFAGVKELDYPKSKIDIYLHYADDLHDAQVKSFLDDTKSLYHSVIKYGPSSNMNQWHARNAAIEACMKASCQYYMSLDGEAQLENPQVLTRLIEANRSVIAPLLVRPGKMWSNFWGSLSHDGFYKRSDDYTEIIQRKKRGQWNVPYMSDAYLIQASRLPLLKGAYIYDDYDPDMAICKRLRTRGIFMYIDNQMYDGHLVDSDKFQTNRVHNDLYMLLTNRYTWERKYLHENYTQQLEPDFINKQPCPDVFWFPLVKPVFCDHLVDEMEHFGKWSGGGDERALDERLNGGYENVPTVDIHTNQIGWETQWLTILRDYISPLAAKVFMGYYPDARATMNFVIRYRPGEQDHLRPHHDSSTFSINIALNTPGVDFQGGGTHFLRQNCSVLDARKGWMITHPGRLTHYHEGLPVKKGTRYIMVSFVDP